MSTGRSQPSRRGRPARSAEQAEADRSRIIASARALFAAEGYAGVSVRKIVAGAGCSPAAVYTVFPSKRRILHSIWEAVFSSLMAALEHTHAQTTGPDRLEALCLSFIDFWLQRPDDYRAIFLIEDRPQGTQDGFFVDSSAALPRMAILRQSIEDAQRRGEIRADDPDHIGNVLLCGLQGIALNLITIPEYPWGDPERLKRDTIRTLLAGLR